MNLNKEQLEIFINDIAKSLGKIKLVDMLAGGVVSDVYRATLKTVIGDQNIVVKYTKKDIKQNHIFSKADIKNSFSKAYLTQDLDVEVQSILSVKKPDILLDFPEHNITLMENFEDKGFKLLQFYILENDVPFQTAEKMGETLAKIRVDLEEKSGIFTQIESSQTQFDERFYELKALLYNGRIEIFNEIENDFLTVDNRFLTWTDGDQKNFAIDEKGNTLVFDFGRSVVCDIDFMLPNLLGHLGLFYLAGYLQNVGKIEDFFESCMKAFLKNYKNKNADYEINEKKFVNYFVASLLHRGLAMRWIDQRIASKIGEDSLKNACMHFGDVIFDKENRVIEIAKMFEILTKIKDFAKDGKYRRPNF